MSTLYDVAKLAKVSPKTVSRVFERESFGGGGDTEKCLSGHEKTGLPS